MKYIYILWLYLLNFPYLASSNQTVDVLHNLLKHIDMHAFELLKTKHTFLVYIQSLQEVVAQYTTLLYDTLYTQMNNPTGSMHVIDVSEG